MEWKEHIVSDVCELIVDCVNKTAPIVDYETEFKMLRTSNIKNGKVDTKNVRYVETEVYKKWTRRVKPQRNDLILTREAPLGEVGLLRSDDHVFLGQRLMLYRANSQVLNQHFLYYSFLSAHIQHQIRALGMGSTVEHIRVPQAEKLKIKLPPLPTQKKIARMLSTYDELIENNQARIAALEQMTQNLYKEWFVRLRFPGHETAEWVEGLPKGWEKKPFSQCVKINPSYKADKNKVYPFVGMEGLKQDSLIVSQTDTRALKGGARFTNYDTLFSRITPCLQNGKIGLVQFLQGDEIGFGSTEFIVFKQDKLPFEYIYLLSRTDSFRYHAINSMSGATGRQRVDNKCFDSFIVKVPPTNLLNDFSAKVNPMFTKVFNLQQKNLLLQQQRDRLLPRLLSGKLKV
ncbi:restriction endonuclease subunit S [uncultured Microscilla sp.]|uniref:restriction endonuclease subunit S n=1 Tax=uncultured Microscilla sp. TaxID=432653 RepID=UPI0026314933|nr:restriction endonuclease subunit S [uncultured Microscilla sp.]